VEKMSRIERARQFMPFAALRGFEELIRQQTVEPCQRRTLSEEDAERLSKKLGQVERGMLVEVTYYAGDGYVTRRGMVSEVDLTMRTLTLVKQRISLDDILDISGEEIRDTDGFTE